MNRKLITKCVFAPSGNSKDAPKPSLIQGHELLGIITSEWKLLNEIDRSVFIHLFPNAIQRLNFHIADDGKMKGSELAFTSICTFYLLFNWFYNTL